MRDLYYYLIVLISESHMGSYDMNDLQFTRH